METRNTADHRKHGVNHRQLPITDFAHNARVVADHRMAAVLAARNMASKVRRAADFNGGHCFELPGA